MLEIGGKIRKHFHLVITKWRFFILWYPGEVCIQFTGSIVGYVTAEDKLCFASVVLGSQVENSNDKRPMKEEI